MRCSMKQIVKSRSKTQLLFILNNHNLNRYVFRDDCGVSLNISGIRLGKLFVCG